MLNVFGPEWRTASHLGNRLPIREVQRKICRAMESLHLRSPLVIASEPAHCRLFEGFGAARKVWYCTDDFAADDGVKCASIRSNEAWALEHADLVMAVSQNLGDRLAPRSRSMLHFPNGVDAEELRQLAARSKPVQGWKDTMRPRIAFLGSVDNRLAYDALLLCMERHRDKSFLLIGGVYEHDETIEPHVRKLRSLPNVHFLGQRDRREVAWILSQCEVGLIPYEVNDFNRACSPLKVFEYAALGLTVIASRLPALQEFGDLVSLIDVASLADVLEREVQGAPTHSVKMRAFADANTWSHRAQFLASHLQQGIAG